VRNASFLVAQQGLDALRALVFAAFVPRLLGPEDFGRFALLIATAEWFALVSGLGTAQLMGRFVPVMVRQDDRATARRLLGNVLAVRMLTGAAAGLVFAVLTRLWLRELPVALVAPFAAAVVLRSAANVPFAFLLGLNQAARWGAGEAARRWSSMLLVVAGTLALGLNGACLGVALAEVAVLALGVWWMRSHLSFADLRLEPKFVAPYVRYGLVFFGSTLLVALSNRGGEALIRATAGDYAQVGYFGLASAAYLTGAQGIWLVLMSFLPLLSLLRAEGSLAALGQWADRLLRFVTAAGVVICFAALLLGAEVVTLLAGPAFQPAAGLLVPAGIAVLAYGVAGVGRLLALTLDRPGVALAAGAAQAATMVGLGIPLAARWGAAGVALAMAAATTVQAVVSLSSVRSQVRLRLGPSAAVAALGVVFLPLAALPVDGLLARMAVFVVFLAGYAVAVRTARLVTAGELRAAADVLRRIPSFQATV
jgi:O-antigen/teichoic acid export membrane protein